MRVFKWDTLSLVLLLSTVGTSSAIDPRRAIASVDLQLLATLLPFTLGFLGSPASAHQSNECSPEADIIFLIDASGSIGRYHWGQAIDFLKNAVKRFFKDHVSKSLQFAAVRFSNGASVQFNINSVYSKHYPAYGLSMIQYVGGGTDMAAAFRVARTQVLPRSRRSAAKVVILLSDGMPNSVPRAEEEAKLLKAEGVHLVSMAIGSTHAEALLRRLDSSPGDALFSKNFDALQNRVSAMVKTACPATTISDYCINSDIVLVVDSSESIGNAANFEKVKEDVKNVVRDIYATGKYVRFGIVQLGKYGKTALSVSRGLSEAKVLQDIDKLNYLGGATEPEIAFENAENALRNPNRKKMMIVVAGGQPKHTEDAEEYVEDLKDKNVRIVTMVDYSGNTKYWQSIADKYLRADQFSQICRQ